MSEFLRAYEVAEILSVSKVTVYRKTRDGLLPPPVKFGVNTLVIKTELDAVIDAYKKGLPQDDIRALIADLIAKR